MRRSLIAVVKPRLIEAGRPTLLTRKMMMTRTGRVAIQYMLRFYLETGPCKPYAEFDLTPALSIDMADYYYDKSKHGDLK